jgi:hypothetical protein
MAYRLYGALIASLGVVALMLAANATFARSGAAVGGASVAAHPMFRPSVARPFGHHRGRRLGGFWSDGGFFYDPSYGESYGGPLGGPLGEVGQPPSGDVHYTYTNDVPWDWVHRFPPQVVPSDRPYVPSCPEETVTVPGRNGEEQTINIMRCY